MIARPADTTLLAKTSSIQVKSRRRESQSNVLSSKLNSIKIKEKPENDHKINESQVEERLSKGTYSNHPFYDRLTLDNRSTKVSFEIQLKCKFLRRLLLIASFGRISNETPSNIMSFDIQP